jgi:hypothetical protein
MARISSTAPPAASVGGSAAIPAGELQPGRNDPGTTPFPGIGAPMYPSPAPNMHLAIFRIRECEGVPLGSRVSHSGQKIFRKGLASNAATWQSARHGKEVK